MTNKLYIGDKEVTNVVEEDDSVLVKLEDDQNITLRKPLYDLIVKDKVGNGNVTDCTRVYIAKEILEKLAEYGLEVVDIEGIASSLGNLVHNLRELKIGEKFGTINSNDIKLSDIIK